MIDFGVLEELMDGDAQAIADVTETFLATTSDALAKAKVALEAGRWSEIAAEAHGARGASATFGVARMPMILRDLEQAALEQAPERLRSLVSEWEHELGVVREFIAAHESEV